MDWQLTSLIVGIIIAVLGGITGFISALLPLWRSKTKIKIVIPYNQGTLYRDEIKSVEFDETTMRDYNTLIFPVVLSSDICVLNLSSRKLVVYSIRLTCRDENKVKHEYHLSKVDTNSIYPDPYPMSVKEPYCELPLQIDADSAKLVSVKFKIDNETKMSDYQIHVHCQDKTFSSELLVNDYSNFEEFYA